MKLAEIKTKILTEAPKKKIQWIKADDGSFEADWMGHKLKVTKDPIDGSKFFSEYNGYLDGKLIKTNRDETGSKTAVMNFLEREVTDVPLTGTTATKLIQHVKHRLKADDLNGWDLDYIGPGNYIGKNKTKAFTVQYRKEVIASEEETGIRSGSEHVFLIQAYYDPTSDRDGTVSMWLSQGGVVSFGIPIMKYKADDLDAMIDTIKTMMKISDRKIMKTLYDKGYDRYGR